MHPALAVRLAQLGGDLGVGRADELDPDLALEQPAQLDHVERAAGAGEAADVDRAVLPRRRRRVRRHDHAVRDDGVAAAEALDVGVLGQQQLHPALGPRLGQADRPARRAAAPGAAASP